MEEGRGGMHVTDCMVYQEIIQKVHVETVATLNPASSYFHSRSVKMQPMGYGCICPEGLLVKGSTRKMYCWKRALQKQVVVGDCGFIMPKKTIMLFCVVVLTVMSPNKK